MHKPKPAGLIALLLVICLCLGGCSGGQTAPENADILLPEPETPAENMLLGESIADDPVEVTLHYASEDSLSLGSMTRRLALDENDRMTIAVLDELMHSAALDSPVEAELLGVEESSGTVTVNLGIEAGVNRSQQDYLLLCASIANTLLELDSVNAVNVLTGGRSDPLCDLPLGVFTEVRDNIAAHYAQVQSESERFPADAGDPLARNVLLYFPSQDGAYLLSEVRQLQFTGSDYASAIIEALAAGPLMRTCSFTPIPENLNLLEDFPLERVTEGGERIIELNFNPALTGYLDFAGVQNWQLYGSMVLSLCSFVPEIDAVRICIGGEPVQACILPERTITFEDGLMHRQDFAAAIGSSLPLYFSDGKAGLIRSETAMAQSAAASPLRMLESLVSAAAPEGCFSVFPEGVAPSDILGVSVKKRIAVVNLSAGFYARCQNLSAQQERQMIYAMVNTLTQLEQIGAVSFLVEGRPVETLSQSIYLKTPLLPDQGLVVSAE